MALLEAAKGALVLAAGFGLARLVHRDVEIYELARGASWIKLGALLLNAAVVGYMCYALWRGGRRQI